MAKTDPSLGEPRRGSSSHSNIQSGERRWLKKTEMELALAELRKLRARSGREWMDPVDPTLNLWDVRDTKKLSWDAVAKRISRSCLPESRTWKGSNAVAAALLGKKVEDIADLTPQSEPSLDESGADGEHSLLVSFPRRIADHRAVILGQLPRPGLHPALFINPQDGLGLWYPQCSGKHNPLRIGSSFAFFAHFGNPNWIGQTDAPALSYHVRVCALTAEWTHGANCLKEPELSEKLAALNPVGKPAEFDVERGSPIEAVTISDHRNRQLWSQRTERIRCQAPVEIGWTGQKDAYIEIRQCQGDRELISQLVKPPVTLTLPGCEGRKHVRSFALETPGLYRVRLYPLRYSFVDPPHEWWLHVSLGEAKTARGNLSRKLASSHHLSSRLMQLQDAPRLGGRSAVAPRKANRPPL